MSVEIELPIDSWTTFLAKKRLQHAIIDRKKALKRVKNKGHKRKIKKRIAYFESELKKMEFIELLGV